MLVWETQCRHGGAAQCSASVQHLLRRHNNIVSMREGAWDCALRMAHIKTSPVTNWNFQLHLTQTNSGISLEVGFFGGRREMEL